MKSAEQIVSGEGRGEIISQWQNANKQNIESAEQIVSLSPGEGLG